MQQFVIITSVVRTDTEMSHLTVKPSDFFWLTV